MLYFLCVSKRVFVVFFNKRSWRNKHIVNIMHSIVARLQTIPALLKMSILVSTLIQSSDRIDFHEFVFWFQIFILINFICLKLSIYNQNPNIQFCWIMSVIELIFTAILLLFYLFSVEKKIGLTWLEIELVFAGVSSLIFMLTSSLVILCQNIGIIKVAAVSSRTITLEILTHLCKLNEVFLFCRLLDI